MISQSSCVKEDESTNSIPSTKPILPGVQACSDIQKRPNINARLIPVGTTSKLRSELAIAAAGNKIVFAGGYDPKAGEPSATVDIFEINTGKWSTALLTNARYDIAVAGVGNIIVFAGGYNGDDIVGITYSTVDIYDASANSWTVNSMSKPMGGRAASVLNNKIFLAGGNQCIGIPCTANFPSVIDIFDPVSNSWSTILLGEGREGLSAEMAGEKIYIAGGLTRNLINTDRIDVYDEINRTWTFDTLVQARGNMASISVGNKIFFAGGSRQNSSNSRVVEIIDVTTGKTSIECLSQPNAWFNAVIQKDKVVFFTGAEWVPNMKDKFDIYDLSKETWSVGVLDRDIAGASIISVNNTIYVAGGYINGVLSNQVWKLEF